MDIKTILSPIALIVAIVLFAAAALAPPNIVTETEIVKVEVPVITEKVVEVEATCDPCVCEKETVTETVIVEKQCKPGEVPIDEALEDFVVLMDTENIGSCTFFCPAEYEYCIYKMTTKYGRERTGTIKPGMTQGLTSGLARATCELWGVK